MKICVFVLYYNDSTLHYIQNNPTFQPHLQNWLFPLFIRTTRYLESTAFLETLFQPEIYSQWVDADYVGTLSWKWDKKINATKTIRSIQYLLSSSRSLPSSYLLDVYYFHQLKDCNLYEQGGRHHKNFKAIWDTLLGDRMGYPKNEIRSSSFPFFPFNYWICRPSWMIRYHDFLLKIKKVTETDSVLNNLLLEDANYGGHTVRDRERLNNIMGRPYYTHHCFVMERLPCFFLWKEGASSTDLNEWIDKRILPPDFNWSFYVHHYPDLWDAGIRNYQKAKEHFLNHGYLERRQFKP